MKPILISVACFTLTLRLLSQSASFQTYMNPVVPGDHPDCTLTKVGKDYYTTGSSFNPTPVIYHSTDLVHWEAVAQPVSASWQQYGDAPAGGCWGGQVVYYGKKYWDFFSRSNQMYFVTADDVHGPWSLPTLMSTPSPVPGLGYDNSIFIDDDGSWYLLVKNGQVNNWIVQLGADGQPSGAVYNLCWINPAPNYPYSWAEGPVMWKHNGYYYYVFARDVSGGEKVFRSRTLTDSSSAWTNLGDFFNLSDRQISGALFQNPNHCSSAVVIDDSTSWVVHPLWRNANNNEWYGQGRQGLLNQVRYDTTGKPTADYPTNIPRSAPNLPSSGIPWMVPHADFFETFDLNPEWSFLGYTPAGSYVTPQGTGWITLSPKGKANTIVKNDGEHNYSIMTRMDFSPKAPADQAGIWVFNGLQTLFAKLYSSVDSAGNRIAGFSYESTLFQVKSPLTGANTILWLKLVRVNHLLTGYCSTDSHNWVQVGNTVNVADMDGLQPNYNSWTGNRQGLFTQGQSARFNCYIYRDAYTPILAECPANQNGTTVSARVSGISSLDNIHDGSWALYAGVEFGEAGYDKMADSFEATASCASGGGVIEVWLDSLDTGTKIATCTIDTTGSWSSYSSFSAAIQSPFFGMHDVYLKFTGTGSGKLFMLQSFVFKDSSHPETSVGPDRSDLVPGRFELDQNYPNPFNPTTQIRYFLSGRGYVSLKIYDILGRQVATLSDGVQPAGDHVVSFDGRDLSSGVYFYRLAEGDLSATRKLLLLK